MRKSAFVQGNKFLRERNYKQAVIKYEEAIKDRPDVYLYHQNLWFSLEKLGKKREALSAKKRYEDLLNSKEWESGNGCPSIGSNMESYPGFSKADMLRAEKNVLSLKRKLLNLGFEDKALDELMAQAESSNPARKLAASRALTLFFLNKGTREGAGAAINYVNYCIDNEPDKDSLRKTLIMKAECLMLLGKIDECKGVLESADFEFDSCQNIILARANIVEGVEHKLREINKIYKADGLTPISLAGGGKEVYSCLSSAESLVPAEQSMSDNAPLVTVIVPAYNAKDTIGVALRSILEQTWSKIEILVVDDASDDGTSEIVESYTDKDSRIKLIRAENNAGPYVARNLALMQAKGDFITTNDADDWSHPQKLQIQVEHLLNNPDVMGNTSQQARATPDLMFHRRGNYGFYVFMNMSSFMFRREVLKDVGFWDSVRFGADSEFIRRIKKVHGADCIVDLKTAPLSFQRQSSDSLTGSSAFGYHGFFMGARREYFESYIDYHARNQTTYFDFPQEKRPFQVPEPMRPLRAGTNRSGQREFDVAIISDFRLDGGSTLSSIEEIKAHMANGLTTALVQMCRYDYQPKKKINPKVRELLEEGNVEFVVYGEKIKCKHALFRYPPILQHRQLYIPDIEADNVSVIVNQPPMSDYGPNADPRYQIPVADNYAREITGKKPIWRPIGPAVREALHIHHERDLASIQLASNDWCNIIDVEDWYRGRYRPNRKHVVIGRHSRDNHHKWPSSKNEILSVYPESADILVKVLGGASTPRKILGHIPNNWEVIEFGGMHPKEFLKDLDVFVYYTNSDWIESFGRVVLEAMAVGVPCILPRAYKALFGDSAIYSDSSNVQEVVQDLVTDDEKYNKLVEAGLSVVKEKFSYSSHIHRLFCESC